MEELFVTGVGVGFEISEPHAIPSSLLHTCSSRSEPLASAPAVMLPTMTVTPLKPSQTSPSSFRKLL